jgi:hypothetical protein
MSEAIGVLLTFALTPHFYMAPIELPIPESSKLEARRDGIKTVFARS